MAKIKEQLSSLVERFKKRKELKPETVKRMEKVIETAKREAKKT